MEKSQTYQDIEKITDEYGQLHEDYCELNSEEGSMDGCTCDMEHLTQALTHELRVERLKGRLEVNEGLKHTRAYSEDAVFRLMIDRHILQLQAELKRLEEDTTA